MSQQQIFEYLKERPGEKFTSIELAEIFKISRCSVIYSLNKLIQYRFIKFEEKSFSYLRKNKNKDRRIVHRKRFYYYEE